MHGTQLIPNLYEARPRNYYDALEKRAVAFAGEVIAFNAGNRDALDVGCGTGWKAIMLAKKGVRSVTAIDVSNHAIAKARESASRVGIHHIAFRTMDAQKMEFEDNTFDLVTGWGILHHLDLSVALAEIARVLRPDGLGVFLEPMGHNPAINLYRRLTPRIRTPDEHPLLMKDLKMAKDYFQEVETHFFNLLTLFALPFRKWSMFDPILARLDRFDQVVFRMAPIVKRFAWMVAVIVSRPAKGNANNDANPLINAIKIGRDNGGHDNCEKLGVG
jgi:ubiquinone/menaquinone biosynthesis C-methylase UbiE